MSIGPDIWGPHLWKSIHMIALGYPSNPTDQQKKYYKSFFEILYHVIPCSLCSDNYKKNLLDLPLSDDVLKNNKSLTFWTIDLHNIVNRETGKKEYSYNEAITHIFNNFNPKNKNNFLIIICLILILIILITVIVVYKKFNLKR